MPKRKTRKLQRAAKAATQAPIVRHPSKWWRWAVVGLATAGVAVSAYLTYLAYSGLGAVGCAPGSGCDVVRASSYSHLFGIPVAIYGIIGYALILALALSKAEKGTRRLFLLLLAVAAVTFSVYLTLVELVVIKAVCPYCVVSAVIAVGILVVLLAQRPTTRQVSRGTAVWSSIAVVAVVLLVSLLPVLSRATASPIQSGIGQPVPQDVMTALTQVPPSTWASVGATGARPPQAVPTARASNSPMTQVLYIGAEYCPYCASQRWPLIVALSRFGQFNGLKLSASSSSDVYPDTPTFSFHGSSFTSQYLKLEAVETESRNQVNGSYAPLETLTPDQQALFRKYDTPPYVDARNAGAIPFLLIGETYLWVGTSFPVEDLKNETWQTMSARLATAQDPASQAVIANANIITAAICKLDGGQLSNVCTNPGVQAAAQLLPSANTGH